MLSRKIIIGFVIALVVLAVAAAIFFFLGANKSEKKKKKKKNKSAVQKVMTKELRNFANAKLTEDQRARARAIIKQHAPSYLEAKYTIETLLPKGQMTALRKGMKAGKANGLTGAELDVAGLAATNLTEEEKARFIDARDRRNSILTTIHSEIEDLLSQEQKTAMSLADEGDTGDRKKKKKK